MIVKSKPAKKSASSKKEKPGASRRGRPSGPGDKALEKVLHEVTAEPDTQPLDEWVQIECPYCGETFEFHATSEQDGQTLFEDCTVCCRPVSLHISMEEGEMQVEAQRS